MNKRNASVILVCPKLNRTLQGFAFAMALCGLLSGRLDAADAPQPTNPPPAGEADRLSAFKRMSLEELLDQPVTSVLKTPVPYGQAPSAIQVITSEDIQRSGAMTIPEALRLADNLEVAQINAHDWAISARGFNADLADKLLVLIDGRAVYTPLYGGVEWNVQDYVMQDIDRIEVISGPGGTQWGANAVNGVINITTKSAKDTQGLYLEAGGGNEWDDFTSVRYGGMLASNVYFRIYGKYFDHDSEELLDYKSAADDWAMGRGGFRIDAQGTAQDSLTVQGDFYSGSEDQNPAALEGLAGGNLLARWVHTFSEDSDINLQVYYDRTHLAQPFNAIAPDPGVSSGFPASALVDDLNTYDINLQHRFPIGEYNKILWGTGYRFTHEVDTDASLIQFLPPELDQNLFNAFVQDEITLYKSVTLTLGTKLEHNDYTGFEVEPSGRLQWKITDKQMVWGAISRAVQTPSRYDEDLYLPTHLTIVFPPYQFPKAYLQGNPDFDSETVIAYELGYRAQLASKLSSSISAFYNDYGDLRSVSATPTSEYYTLALPDYFANNLEGDTYGFEWTGTYEILPNWRLHAGYDLLKEDIHPKPGTVDITDGYYGRSDPQQQFSIRTSIDPIPAISLDAALRWVDELHTVDSPTTGPALGTVPSYFELDSRIAWRATKHWEFAIVGQNLLHSQHVEFGYPTSQEEIVRSVFAKAIFRW